MPESPSVQSRLDVIERVVKFTVALIWGTLELAMWGARPASFVFIATILGVTEAARLAKLKGGDHS